MKRNLFRKALSAFLAVALCVGMVPAVTLPVAAADVGSNEWVVRNDGFEDYPVGLDTFWKNERYSGFYSGHHGIYGSDSYATYDIVEENGDKMLQMVSMKSTSCYFDLPTVSGAYSLSVDFCMKKSTPSVPGLVMNIFDGASIGLPGRVSFYVDATQNFRLIERFTDASADTTQTIKKADGTEMKAAYDTWFTVKLSVTPGKFVFKAWPRDEQEPAETDSAGVIVIEHASITEQVLSNNMTGSIQSRSRNYEGVAHTVLLDNLKITKPYDSMTLPTALQGASGDRLAVEATFTGQDLNAQVPAPRFNYTFSNPDLGHAGPGDYLILGKAGQGTVTVELADMDGKGTGVTRQIPLTVAQATQSERPLRVLSIGNGYSRDSLYYLSHLADLVGEQVEFAYLHQEDATLRYHAHNVAKQTADYSYYVSDPETGAVTLAAAETTINEVVNGQNWDIVMLQQGGAAVGMNNTFAGDLRYLLDYLADAQPNAKVYWNMNAAEQQDSTSRDDDTLDAYYDGSQTAMYNAIVGTLDMFIVGEDAEYADDFDGWFPVGAAIQNLRATSMGDTLTRDGDQLSLQAGRLAAAMTVLKVLFPDADLTKITPDAVSAFLVTDKTDDGVAFAKDPDYTNNAANMTLIRQSVEAACANLNVAPAKLAYAPKTIEGATKDPTDVTVGQTDAPLNLRFADIVVTRDGTVYAGAYEAVTHVPARDTLPYTEYCPEGYGRLKIWKGSSDGKNWYFDDPILTIDQHELDDWGISPGLYNRYERLKSGVQDYAFFNDARDANLGLMYYDMDGNGTEDEVLLFTFFCNDYNESGDRLFKGTFLMHSIDGGETWSIPQRIVSTSLGGGGKRGDMAVFSDGQLLFPMYSNPRVAGVLLQWNVDTQQWDTIADAEIENYVPEKTTDFTEPSFIAPDPDGDVVYGFVRDNGQAVISYDRGRTWEHIHTIEGNVQQPGWAYIDENRAFATWSFSNGGTRPTKGQMVYFDAGWEATQPQVVHDFYNPVGRDTGDPSAKLLQNGRLLAINYDTYFRAINGKFIDPNAPEFQLPELYSGAAEITLHEVTPTSVNLTVGEDLPVSHTVKATATFAAGGKLTITAANGAVVEFAAGRNGVSANKATELRVAVISGVTYAKAWAAGGTEPESWTAVTGGTDANSGKAVFTGTGVTLNSVKITRRATMVMAPGSTVITGMSETASLSTNPADMADQVVWTVSDPEVASVDGQGKLVFKQAGSVTVTATLGGKSVSADYEVEGTIPDEAAGVGETRTIFTDDFEDYTAGTDAFMSQMVSHGYAKPGTSAAVMQTGYHIVEENGNRYLELVGDNGKYAWCVVDTPISGDYTVQFDFYHPAESVGKGTTFLNLWQTTNVYAMVQMSAQSFRVQHVDADTGLYMNSKTYDDYGVDAWYTMKVARVDGGVYAKVWLQGTAEPEHWQFCALAEEMTTNNTAKFRFSSAAGEDESRSVRIDNILITKQRVPNPMGTNEWVVRSDDFNDRTVGEDTFWKDAKYGGFTESNHKKEPSWIGSMFGAQSDYSYYGIAEENGNKVVELTTGRALYNVFTTTTVSGAYSVTTDICMPKPSGAYNPGIVINPFYGTSLSGKASVYIDGNDGVRLRESLSTGSAVNSYVNGADGKKVPFKLDTWYTVKVSVEPGRITVKVWLQGEQEPSGTGVGVYVFDHDGVTLEVLNGGLATSFQTRTRDDQAAYVVRLDNITITKPYKDLGLPQTLTGEPGQTVTLTPEFSGQDLAALTPAPTIRYSTSNAAVAGVTAAGVVTLGEVGEGKIMVELLDMDGKSHGVNLEIPVIVAEEPEPEPEPEEPDEPEEESSTLGYFSLEVINYIIVNGEEVAICRWKWTPMNKK